MAEINRVEFLLKTCDISEGQAKQIVDAYKPYSDTVFLNDMNTKMRIKELKVKKAATTVVVKEVPTETN